MGLGVIIVIIVIIVVTFSLRTCYSDCVLIEVIITPLNTELVCLGVILHYRLL